MEERKKYSFILSRTPHEMVKFILWPKTTKYGIIRHGTALLQNIFSAFRNFAVDVTNYVKKFQHLSNGLAFLL
jgi:hypothetical protein